MTNTEWPETLRKRFLSFLQHLPFPWRAIAMFTIWHLRHQHLESERLWRPREKRTHIKFSMGTPLYDAIGLGIIELRHLSPSETLAIWLNFSPQSFEHLFNANKSQCILLREVIWALGNELCERLCHWHKLWGNRGTLFLKVAWCDRLLCEMLIFCFLLVSCCHCQH